MTSKHSLVWRISQWTGILALGTQKFDLGERVWSESPKPHEFGTFRNGASVSQ